MPQHGPGGERRAESGEHRQPTARVARRALEAAPDIPAQMAYAVEQVKQKREGPAEQAREADGACEQARAGAVALLAARERDQPEAERQQAQAQGDSGESVQDRQGIADLPAINS